MTTKTPSTIRVVTIWSTYGDYHLARLNALAEHGFEVVPFAYCEYEPTYPFFRAKPDSLVVVNRGSLYRINPLLSLLRTWCLLRMHRPDVVLTTGYERPESLAAWLYSRTARGRARTRPLVILMTENRADDHRRNHLIERVKSWYLRAYDGFLTSGTDSRAYLQGLGVPSTKIEVGYSCVDNGRIRALVAEYRTMRREGDYRADYFLCVARLVAKKNISGLLRAYDSYRRLLPDSERPAPLVICGDGPERGAIADLIRQLALTDSVTLVGVVRGLNSLAKQLAGCRAFVLASTWDETWGLVVNEAMAAGCAVLVSKQCGCARDLVAEGVNGFTFDANDPDALARHMLWIHNNDGSLAEMGNNSARIIERFTPANFATSASRLASSALPCPS